MTSSAVDAGTTAQSGTVHANGIDIHYLEAGAGEPLLLLHGGVVSTNHIWTGVPVAYASHMDTLAQHFPGTGGRTRRDRSRAGCGEARAASVTRASSACRREDRLASLSPISEDRRRHRCRGT
jgi:hypothetical protein